MFDRIRKLFRMEVLLASKIDLSGMSAPGRGFIKTSVVALAPSVVATSNEPVIAPQPVVVQSIAPVVKVEPGICHACGQMIQPKTAPVVDPAILNEPWNDLDRVDLEPRTSTQIQLLIAAGETPDNREKRIWNDKLRWSHCNGR
jgi:hypothetical protein